MDNSIYIVLSKQVAQFRQMDVVANNISNANTAGFQAEKMLFNDYLVDDGNREKMAFAQDIATYHDLRPGSLRVTGNPLDMAISGEGYFTIGLPDGRTAYSRAGNFQRDATGLIVTSDGLPVLDEGGQRIQLNPDDTDISVGENGLLLVNGEERAVIGMAEFANRQDLEQLGASLFAANDQLPLPPANSRMLHGVVEDSNVSAVQELVAMTKVSRSVGSTSKFIEVMYDLQRRANNVYAKEG